MRQVVVRAHRRAAAHAPAALLAHLLALCIYAALALYLLARVLPQAAGAIPGAGVAQEDGWQNTWNMWWVRLALARGQNPYHTDMLFFPTGASLYLHTLNITNSLLTLPVLLATGPVAAYNAAVALGLVLTGYGTFLLAQHVLGQRGVAVAAGAVVAFSPFHLAKVWDGHLSWVTMQWIPFAILCLLRALETGRWRWRAAAGAVLAGAALTSWYYALFSAIFAALLMAVRAPPAWRERRWRSEALTLLAVGAIAGALLSPVLVPALSDYRSGAQVEPRYPPQPGYGPAWDGETSIYSADLLDMLFPSFMHPLWGRWSADLHQAMRPGWFWQIAPGYAVLALALVGALARWRRAWQWAALAAALWVLTLGPRLRVAGENTGVALPFDWLQVVPGMTLGHRPNHLMIFLLPALALLAGYGMLALSQRGGVGKIALAALCALLVAEYAVAPLPALALPVSPASALLAEGQGAVLDLPPDRRTAIAMIYQVGHGRPIVGGYLARQPDTPALVARVPAIRQLWQMRAARDADIVAGPTDEGEQALSYYGIRTIALRVGELERDRAERALAAIRDVAPSARLAFESEALSVYELGPVREPRPFLLLGEGWMEAEGKAPDVRRWMGATAQLTVVNPASEARMVRLALTATSYQQPRDLTVQIDGQRVGAFAIPTAARTLHLALVLPPGEHTIDLSSTTGREQASPGRELSVLVSRVAVEP